jgi:hypothetical protein
MLIVIPSLGRADQQITVRNFRTMKIANKPVLVVPEKEFRRYEMTVNGAEIVAAPASIVGISATREWILDDFAKQRKARHVLMLDDDMDFCWRPDIKSPKLETIKDGAKLQEMLDTLEGWLVKGFVHVGVSARQGNNHEFRNAEGVSGLHAYRDVTRMMNAYAYDTVELRKLKVSVSRNKVMHDFDLTLQLLRKGLPNRVSFEFCWNQRGSNKAGGCSTYRDGDMQKTSAEQLASDHPGFVKVIMKKTKEAWKGMQERYDVIVQWQKAFESSKGGAK